MKTLKRFSHLLSYKQPSSILIENATVITLGTNNQVLKDHSIFIENGVIKSIAPTHELTTTANAEKTINGAGNIVMPGIINSHMHFYSSYARGLGKAEPSKNFLEVLQNLWWKLDKLLTVEDSYYSAMIALIGAIKNGTTTFIDHHASPMGLTGSLMAIARALDECGIRGSLCYEVSDRDGPEIALEGIEENVDFIKYCQAEEAKGNDFLRGMFGLHASFTIENETLKMCSEEGNKLDSGFHIHCCEGTTDQEKTREKYGMGVIERLNSNGILGPKTILGHCIDVNDSEMDIIAQTGTTVVHNPQSNMNNSVGIADIVKMNEKGILVGLGTDAMTTNMLEELRSAMWVQKLNQNDPSSAFMETTSALVLNNAEICGKYWGDIGIGELRNGGVADLVMMEYYPPTQFDEETFLGHLVFGISQERFNTTIVDGKILMENGRLTTIDEESVMREAAELSKILWDKF